MTAFRQRAKAGGISVWVLMSLLLIAVAAAIWSALPMTAGEQVRRHLLGKLRSHYRDAHVDIRSARYEPGRGIIIEQLVLGDARRQSDCQAFVRIEQIVVDTNLSLQRLVDFDFSPKTVTLRGMEVKSQIDPDGRLAVEKFMPLPNFGPGAETIFVERGSLAITDAANPEGRPVVIREIRGQVLNRPANPEDPKRYQLTAESDFFESLDLLADVTPEKWNVRSRIVRGTFDRALASQLPFCVRQRISKLTGLSTVCDAVFSAEGDSQNGIRNWVGKVDLIDGRYESPFLPYQLERLQGEFLLRPQGLEVVSLSARIGDALCQAKGTTQGWSWPMPIAFSLDTEELLLHEELASCTPQKCQEIFQRLLPRGRIAANANVRFDGQKWSWQSAIQCLGVDVQFDRFPYPVKDIRGTILCSDRETVGQGLVGRLEGQPLRCNVRLEKADRAANNRTTLVELSTQGPLTIDETLLTALTPRGESTSKLETLVRSLNVSGKVALASSRFESWADGTRTKLMDLRFEQSNLRYDRFAYPIHDIQGQVLVENDVVHISNMRGQSIDSASISARGICQTEPAGTRFQLEIDGYGISMDQSLRRVLAAEHQSIWDTLGPSGVLEHLNVLVDLPAGATVPKLKIMADQYPRDDTTPRSVSITPESLPYRLNITGGRAEYVDDQVLISDLQGWHGQSRLNAQGRCVRQQDGRWVLSVDAQPPTRVLVDNDLLTALPQEVQGTFRAMQLYGPPVSLRGTANFAFPDRAHPDLDFDWDLRLQLEGNRIGDAGPVHDIRGEVHLAGERIDQATIATGSVRLDSMHVDNVQITNVEGPILIREDQLFVGQAVHDGSSEAVAASTKSIRGGVFGGIAELDGQMDLTSGRFDVNGRFDSIDFATLLRDMAQPASQTKGKGRAVMRLRGLLGDFQTLSGQGSARLTDASLYELPAVVRLLNILSVKPTHDGDLSNCEMQFRLDGEQIHFDDIRIWGDILVLRGSGTANLRQELDLRFETGVSPNNLWSRLLNPLKDQQYTLWTIDVTGTLANPVFDKRTLKQIEQALERLFPEFDGDSSSRRSAQRTSRQELLTR
ncbi:AsmA-like C-terminal region-containing protein [Rosistilla carotiformis]|uniref:AsmA-like C-terminal region-containing protein n=1 Tax=Rosistilla carotiformis TaxID=2528017 RepID=UPI0018D26FD6|nr:AsmA-like C-terminal region-containing protein [Rosistilla carotiformis]